MMNYKLAENISWRDIQGQVLILDPRINQKAHELNPIASYIWTSLADGQSYEQIANTLSEHYRDQLSPQQIEEQAKLFIDELVALKLLHHAP